MCHVIFNGCHRHTGDASSWPRRRGDDSGATNSRENRFQRGSNSFEREFFFLWVIRMPYFFKFIERRGYVLDKMTRWEFWIEKYLLICLSFFFLLLLLFRIYHCFCQEYCKKIKFKLNHDWLVYSSLKCEKYYYFLNICWKMICFEYKKIYNKKGFLIFFIVN